MADGSKEPNEKQTLQRPKGVAIHQRSQSSASSTGTMAPLLGRSSASSPTSPITPITPRAHIRPGAFEPASPFSVEDYPGIPGPPPPAMRAHPVQTAPAYQLANRARPPRPPGLPPVRSPQPITGQPPQPLSPSGSASQQGARLPSTDGTVAALEIITGGSSGSWRPMKTITSEVLVGGRALNKKLMDELPPDEKDDVLPGVISALIRLAKAPKTKKARVAARQQAEHELLQHEHGQKKQEWQREIAQRRGPQGTPSPEPPVILSRAVTPPIWEDYHPPEYLNRRPVAESRSAAVASDQAQAPVSPEGDKAESVDRSGQPRSSADQGGKGTGPGRSQPSTAAPVTSIKKEQEVVRSATPTNYGPPPSDPRAPQPRGAERETGGGRARSLHERPLPLVPDPSIPPVPPIPANFARRAHDLRPSPSIAATEDPYRMRRHPYALAVPDLPPTLPLRYPTGSATPHPPPLGRSSSTVPPSPTPSLPQPVPAALTSRTSRPRLPPTTPGRPRPPERLSRTTMELLESFPTPPPEPPRALRQNPLAASRSSTSGAMTDAEGSGRGGSSSRARGRTASATGPPRYPATKPGYI